MPVAIVSVTNDLTTDQRVHRTCMTLVKAGYEPVLVGRRMKNSRVLSERPYRMHRMRLLFDAGPGFYAEYNISLFFYLLFHNCDLLVSNDLDVLPANYAAFRLKRLFMPGKAKQLRHIHDCHEYFRGVPELVGRIRVTNTWKWLEDRIFPKLKHVIAVNQSVADLYRREYSNRIAVVRNVPFRKGAIESDIRVKLNISSSQKIILYQGAVNVDRGLEEAIRAMRFIRTDAVLIIAGVGDISEDLKTMTILEGLSSKVIFAGQIPFGELHAYTCVADLGLSIEKDVSINYHYCLPNKFLDYIQANVPVLVSPFPEMRAIVDRYRIGEYIENHDPAYLAGRFDEILNDAGKIAVYKQNLAAVAKDLCWENEEQVLMDVVMEDAG